MNQVSNILHNKTFVFIKAILTWLSLFFHLIYTSKNLPRDRVDITVSI